MKKFNFSAGPSILPQPVFQKASEAVLNFNNTGLSILEQSHRGADFVAVLENARSLVMELLGLSSEYEVLFLQGGASSQFYMLPYNLLSEQGKVAYIDTGAWSKKAIKEAKLFGNTEIIASSEESGYNYIPKEYSSVSGFDYIHITTNNTIYGTEFHNHIDSDCLIVADMSSDIFSRPWDYSKYDLIYAGAQKNLGPAGTTLVIVRKDILGNTGRDIPTMIDYRTHIEKKSAFNTWPVFPVYVSMLTLEWLKENGGLETMGRRNKEKADHIYNEIDRNSLFDGFSAIEDRSVMNATFTIKDSALESAFVEYCADKGVVGIKGHRSVGGFRASIYNAMELEGVNALVDCMKDFENQHS